MEINNNRYYNEKQKPVKGTLEVAAGGYLGYKALTSGVRRTLGVRIEEHTTTALNAKNILKNGKFLDPRFGGTGAATLTDNFSKNSKGFVHITGLHGDMKSVVEAFKKQFKTAGVPDSIIDSEISKITEHKVYKAITETPLLSPAKALYRKTQRLLYRSMAIFNIGKLEDLSNNPEILDKNFGSPSKVVKTVKDLFFSKKAKTLYIGGTDKYFSSHFMPDDDDIALKTKELVKVSKTKFGAMIDAIKKEGLTGIKQNKTRVAGGALIALSLGFLAYKLIKNGINNIKGKKAESSDKIKQ